MPYDPEKKQFIGDVVDEPIKQTAISTVGKYVSRMRQNPTEAERALYGICDQVRKWIGNSVRFVKQRPFFLCQGITFIGDAFFKKYMLLVEVDGRSHDGEEQREKDAWRDRVLIDSMGIMTLRLTNEEALNNRREVAAKILRAMTTSPNAVGFFRRLAERQLWRIRDKQA